MLEFFELWMKDSLEVSALFVGQLMGENISISILACLFCGSFCSLEVDCLRSLNYYYST